MKRARRPAEARRARRIRARSSSDRETSLRLLLVALAPLVLAGCVLPFGGTREGAEARSLRVVGSQADCSPRFEDQDGWLGGDVAASIPLLGIAPRPTPSADPSMRRSVWLFGDSFVARTRGERERSYPFVHNALAVSTCDAAGRWSMDFAWREGDEATGGARAFFAPAGTPSDDGTYAWPISGALVGKTLVVALLRVEAAPPSGPFALPFRAVGVDLAQLEPSEAPPEHWPIRHARLSRRSDLLPAVSLVVDGGWLYAFATVGTNGRAPRTLTRLPLTALADAGGDLEPFLETLDVEGRWQRALPPEQARILMADDATEMSVHFDPGRGEWLAVYSDPTPEEGAEQGAAEDAAEGPADAIWLRRAERLEGPWSAPQVLGRVPELGEGADPLPGEPFCYAAKAHPELAPSGELFVTWVCNYFAEREEETAAVLERLRTARETYRPRFGRFVIPPEPRR